MKPKRNLTNTELTELAMCLENEGKFYSSFINLKSAGVAYSLILTHTKLLRLAGHIPYHESGDERELLRYYLAQTWEINQVLDDANRRHIDDRYKDFYSREDDYDPDNVKVKVHDPEPAWKAVTADLSDLEMRALAVSADSYQLQGEIAGHAARAQFFLDKVEAALSDGFKTATTTGRMSSSMPDFQQLPKSNQPKPADIGTTSEFNTMTKIITIRTVTTVSTDAKENSVTTYVNGTDIKTLTSAQIYGLISDAETLVDTLSKIQNKPLQLQAEIAAHKDGIAALVKHLDERFLAENPGHLPAKPKAARKAPVKAAEDQQTPAAA